MQIQNKPQTHTVVAPPQHHIHHNMASQSADILVWQQKDQSSPKEKEDHSQLCHQVHVETPIPAMTQEDFYDWFSGFYEGDGAVCISYRKARKIPELTVSFTQKDRTVLEWIQRKLGFGSIYKHSQNASVLKISKKNEVERIFYILNGRLRFPHRYEQVRYWIEVFDEYHKTTHRKTLKPLCDVDLTTAWLSGFTQSEGHFTRQKSPRTSTSKLDMLRIGFTQNKGMSVFSDLKVLLGTGSLRLDRNTTRFIVSSKQGLGLLVDYFQRFPLQGIKSEIYQDWYTFYKHREEIRAILKQKAPIESPLRNPMALHANHQRVVTFVHKLVDVLAILSKYRHGTLFNTWADVCRIFSKHKRVGIFTSIASVKFLFMFFMEKYALQHQNQYSLTTTSLIQCIPDSSSIFGSDFLGFSLPNILSWF